MESSGPALNVNTEHETRDDARHLGLSGAKTMLECDAAPSDLPFGVVGGEIGVVSWIASLQHRYLWRDELGSLASYSEGFTDKDDRDGSRRSVAVRSALPPHALSQIDWMVGLPRDVTPAFMRRAEYQGNRGTSTLSARGNPLPTVTAKDWRDAFSARLLPVPGRG